MAVTREDPRAAARLSIQSINVHDLFYTTTATLAPPFL
jgi:hypothetical protein